MALRSFGKVTVASAGTPVQATVNESVPGARVGVNSIFVQALAGNVGTNIYVGKSTMVKATLVGVYFIVPKGGNAYAVINLAPAGINMNELYIDADTNSDACLISATEQ